MSSILNENLIDGTPEEEFAFAALDFSRTYSDTAYKTMQEYAKKNFTKISGKLCWKKYCYFAISKPTQRSRWNPKKNDYDRYEAPGKIIITSECYVKDSWGRGECVVFRATGKTGPKDRRGQWFKTYRTQDDPILSSGWKYSDYEIFQMPVDMFGFLYDFLPHKPEKFPDSH